MSERVWYRSIYWRIAIGFIVFLAVMLAAQGGLFLWIVARADGALPAHSLVEFANVIASDLGNEIEQDPRVDIGRYIRDHYGQMSRRVFVVMPDGRFFASHAVARSAAVVDRAKEWLAKGAPAEVETMPFRFGRLIAFSRLFVNGVAVGTVAVQPGGPSARLIGEIVPTMLLMVGVLMLGGTALAALLIFRPVNRRLKGLEEAARRLGAGDLAARAPVGGGDETTAVAKAFNRMADDLATRAAQLQASDRARRQLFADVSHELMTPLTAIHGYVETLALPDLKADENTRRRYLGIIEQETLRLEAIVGDLLDLARLEAGGGTLKLQDVRVQDLFGRVTARHERQSQENRVALAACIEPGAEIVTADPDRLEQALQNLATNAFRYTPAGGRVELRAAPGTGHVVLQVRDTGHGIPPEHLPMIFDRFYKVDASRSGSETGSGLGLSIVKAIVERHGGTISVRSQPDVETVFEIKLPRS
jgi:two-component system OmpR family sensor kinase